MTGYFRVALFCSAAAAAMSSASAQEQTSPADTSGTAATTDSGPVGEIIVTATRRATNLQDTALSITALDAVTLDAQGIRDTVSLQQVTPGLTFNQNSTFAQPYIRGIGTDITTPGSESSVATFVDGVYQPFPFVGVQVLNAIESIEVLKGPQGTLYGRNATGGSINVRTRDPGRELALEGDFTYGNYDAKVGRAYVSVPLSDQLAFNVAGSISVRDGYGKNLANGQDYNSEDYKYVRGKLRWRSGDIDVVLSAYYFRRDDDSFMAYTYDPRWGSIPAPGALGGRVTLLSQDVYAAYPVANDVEDYGGNLRIGLKIGQGELTSITAYQKASALIGPDFVSTDVPIFNFAADKDTGRNFSQDLYYAGDLGAMSFTIGGMYANASARFDALRVFLGTAPATDAFQFVDTRAFAGYGELSYKFSDQFSVTGGIRYSNEKKTQDRLDTYAVGGPLISSAPRVSRTWDNTSFKALAQYDVGDFMAYAKFESGFKSGSVVAAIPGLFIDPETINSYEAGFKSDLLDRHLRLNMAAFYYDYKNIQVQYTDVNTGQALVESADKARIWGIEAQINVAPSRNFNVNIGFNYLNSRYIDFVSSGAFIPNTVAIGPGVPGNVNRTVDVSGNELVRSPSVTVNADFNWKIPFANGGVLTNSGSIYFSDQYYFEVTNRARQPSYATVGAQIRYDFPGEKFGIAVFGRNLSNTRYLVSMAPNSFGDAGQMAPPRTYGITLSAKM